MRACLKVVVGLSLSLAATAQETVEVTGRAVGVDGEALAGISVVAVRPDRLAPFAAALDTAAVLDAPETRSGEDGRFRIDVPRGGWIYVAAERRVAQQIGHARFLSERAFDLGDLVLARGSTLVGRVRRPDGTPVAGAHVVVRGRLPGVGTRWGFDAEVSPLAAGTTGVDGSFRVRCAAPAGLEVTVFAAGHGLWTRYPVSLDTPLSIDLEPLGFFSGRVVDAAGAPLEARIDARYEVMVPGDGRVAHTGPDGRFQLTRLAPARARLVARVEHDGFTALAFSPVLDDAVDGLVLRPSAPASEVAEPPPLVVTVVDETGAPVSGAEVRVGSARAGPLPSIDDLAFRAGDLVRRTADDGTVSLPGLRRGEVRAVVRIDAPARARALAVIEPGTAALRIRLGPEARIAGRVVDADGAPVAGARVWWIERRPGQDVVRYGRVPDGAVVTGLDGRFELVGVPPTSVDVQVEHADHLVPFARPVVPVAAETARLDIGLERGRRIEVRVEGVDTGLVVSLRPAGAVTVAGGTQALFAPSLALPAARRTETGGRLFAPVRAGGLVVTLSRPSRTALPYPLEFDVAHLGATEAGEVVVPASRIATGVIAGQVTTGDAPFSRLCVAAGWAGGRDGASRPRGTFSSPLDAGGRYALELPPGAYRLRVVDMRSGLTVAQGDAPVEVEAGAQVDAPLVPSLHVLRIELVPRRAEGIVRPCTLHVGTTGALASSGMLDLWPGERTVDLLVPEAPLWIKVRDGSGMLVARGGSPTRWVAEVDLDADEVSRGVLSVAVDPPLMAEALGDGAPSGEGR